MKTSQAIGLVCLCSVAVAGIAAIAHQHTAEALGGIDPAGAMLTVTRNCASLKQSQATVGNTAVPFPNNTPGHNSAGGGTINAGGQLANRRYVVICMSKRTASTTALLTVSVDGHTPTATATDVGAVLGIGDCGAFQVNEATIPQVISDTASTYVTALECQ